MVHGHSRHPRHLIADAEQWQPVAAPARHAYAKPGTYRAHVTVTSSGCDGADVQVGTASARVTIG